ncbi:MAG: chemotaxis protein CheA [Desulfococcaceae bacterium]|nr:chemotaxis protein CheA [Desulfococcaceae bacterium]
MANQKKKTEKKQLQAQNGKQIKSYREQFCQESFEIIEKVCDDILKAEAEPDDAEILNAIFRGVHTIKGSAGTFGLDSISDFVHHLESLLDELRKGNLQLGPEMTDMILAYMDHISRMIKEYQSGKQALPDADLIAQVLLFQKPGDIFSEIPAESPVPEKPFPMSLEEISGAELREEFRADAQKDYLLFRICLHYTSEHLENGYDPLVFLRNLHAVSHHWHPYYPDYPETSPVPPIADFTPLRLFLNPCIYVSTRLSYEEIFDLTFDPSLLSVQEIHTGPADCRPFVLPDSGDPESLREFILGSSEMLESAERAVIEYEKEASEAAINEIFRVAHNIKGDADFIGLQQLTQFAHALESLLEKLRSGSVRPDKTADILLSSVDFLRQNIRKLEQGFEITVYPPVYEKLKEYQKAVPEKKCETDKELHKIFSEQLRQYQVIIRSHMEAAAGDEKARRTVLRALQGISNAARVMKSEEIGSLSDKTAADVSAQESGDIRPLLTELLDYILRISFSKKRIGEILLEGGKISEADLHESLLLQQQQIRGKDEPDESLDDVPLSEAAADQGRSQEDVMETMRRMHSEEPAVQEVRTMRVDEQKIGQLTNLAGELLIARNAYDYLLDELRNSRIGGRDIQKLFKENLHLFTRLTNDIHYGVMALRMVPVSGLFRKFSRIVRDISRRQDKKIDLSLEGEEVEIDKKAAEVLTDPLVHLVRNACDHGIEKSAERMRLGKSERGSLLLKASHEASNLCICIRDDGSGIDRLKLYEKIKNRFPEISSPDAPGLLDTIFLPGISTREEAGSFSGRGVGMDVVKTAVQSLGGTVQVRSETGNGTEIRLYIPMTMGIDEVLLIESGVSRYALSLSCIVETLKIRNRDIKRMVDRMLFHYRGEVLWLYPLEDILQGHKSGKGPSVNEKDKEISVIILQTARGKFGLTVHRFIRNMELAIRPVPRQLAGLDIASGVSIMGDGRIILVLNPEKLL